MSIRHLNKQLVLPALLLGLGAASVGAAPAGRPAPRRAAPIARPAASVTSGIRETRLPNGLRVVTRESHSAPVVNFSVWYRVGSRNEHNGITGTSHLLEHMMFKGTQKYRVGEISRTLFANGAEFNAATSYDYTEYYETLSSDRLELAMQIESDRMTGSRIDKSDLDSEMSVVRSELEGGENSPDELLSIAVQATAFQAHPYHWPVIGWRSDVENVPRDAIYQYYRTHYGPNNATVVIVGDFNTDQALAMVRKYFGALKPIPVPAPVYTTEPPQRGERRVTIRRAGSLPLVQVAYKSPEAKSPDFYALDALAMVLGSGRTSRLYQGLVEKQVATAAEASDPTMRDPYLFDFSATARPGTTPEQLEQALLAEIERVKTEPVSDEELTRAKNKIEAQFVFQNDSVTEQASQIGYWSSILDWRYLTTYLARVKALTPADLQRVAQKYFIADGRTVGYFIPTTQEGPSGPPPKEAGARVEKARPGDRPIPLPKPTRKPASARNVTRFKLDNGLSVVVQENHANPTFAMRGTLNAGKVVEPPTKPGLASITAAMLSRGTERHSALQFASELEDVGASLGAGADTLTTTVSAEAQAKDFDRVIGLMGEMLRQPVFPERDLERLKGQVLAGLEEEKDDPGSLANRAFERVLYPAGSPLRPASLEEARQSVESITRDDVQEFYRTQYGPQGMILVIAGDVKAERVREALQSRLGDWPANTSARPLPALDVPLQPKGTRQVIRVADKSEAEILWGHAGTLKRSDPDFYASQVLNLILAGAGALSGRLSNTIRDQQGLAYTVFTAFDASLYPGPFEVMLGTNPANAQKAVTALDRELRQVLAHGVTQREVDEAVAFQTGGFPVRLETNSGMAQVLWVAEYYGLGPNYIDKYGDYYRAVTVAQVNAAAKKHLRPDAGILVISGTVPEK
jgi:zinc protease